MKIVLFVLLASASINAAAQTETPAIAAFNSAASEKLRVHEEKKIAHFALVSAASEAALKIEDPEIKLTVMKGLKAAWDSVLESEEFYTGVIKDLSGLAETMKTPGPTPDVKAGDLFPEVVLRDGKTYKNAKVKSYDAGAVIFSHDGGMARVPLANLSDDLQAKFAYDATVAAESERLMWERQKAIPKLTPPPAPAPVDSEDAPPSAPVDGINLYGIGAKALETNSDTYVDVAWKVTVLNHGPKRSDGVSLRFLFLDEKGFQVEEEIEYPLSFAPGETRTITGKSFMLRSIWAQVDSYRVKTR